MLISDSLLVLPLQTYGANIIEIVNGMPVQLYSNNNLTRPEVHMLEGIVPGGMYQITGQNLVSGYPAMEDKLGIILRKYNLARQMLRYLCLQFMNSVQYGTRSNHSNC